MLKRISITTILLLAILSSVSYAASNEWKDKNYDFNTIKKVALIVTFAPSIQDQFAQQKTNDVLANSDYSKLNVTFIPFMDLITQIGKDIGIDPATADNATRAEIFKKVPQYVDAVLVVRVNQLGWFKQYVPPRSFTYTTNTTSQVYGRGGYAGSITTPTDKTIQIPGGYEDFPVAAMEFTMLNVTTAKLIWGYSEDKNDRGGGLFSKKNKPEDNMDNIVRNVLDHIPLSKK